MSFTLDVKGEIAQIELEGSALKAQLAALIQLTANLTIHEKQLQLSIQTESAAAAKKLFKLIKSLYNPEITLSAIKKSNLKKNNIYQIKVTTMAKEILNDLGLWTDKGLMPYPNKKIISKVLDKRAYLAGAFLAAGSVNSPLKSNYHLEIVTQSDELAQFVMSVMHHFDLPAKVIMRRNQHVVYLKASDKISDFLRIVSANQAVLDFEDIRIQRDFHNSLTRLDNCEVANEMKILHAGQVQVDAILELKKQNRIGSLDYKYTSVIELRLENPEASLNELCDLYYQKTGSVISKSGMKHRLMKILALV